ncbi:putative photolyase [Cafeteria roenbergensis virus]|uniref:Putative photolyase n=1 Tax=Cafeteria roenbergensis virus (strain BV-PW1) TaxID=693272 RepID=E3T4R9_CROVB|nr:putative photolyase [Cafeteria roenbergensis virus BV-PW1]ADO67182.1 putative photolyase [Cafeteria roenbergensis virus BV-PW1]
MFILFPTQLFRNIKLLNDKEIYLVEEPFYFTRLQFHKLKIAYHRATMKKYFDDLKKKKFNIKYIDFSKVKELYHKYKTKHIEIYHPIDIPLLQQLKTHFKNIYIHPTINFTFNHLETTDIKKACFKNGKYYHDDFYKFQRKRLDIMMINNKPLKDKYSFDNMNRKTFPKNIKIPELPKIKQNKYIKEAIKYTLEHFSKNYGSLENFIYPISLTSSRNWFKIFLQERLKNYGPYQDAVDINKPFGFHAVISPMMNVGMLTDTEVIKISYEYYQTNKNNIPINSFEGFIRQVIGWRNYVYLIYLEEGDKIKQMNFLNHTNKLSNKWWEGNTGILPLDDIIKKIVNYAYAHHIERLMYLGNFLLISQVDPNEVYRIFMEWTIDSYDWVMVPNVYGMSQFSDGGLMMSRTYFSSSNYIQKMSNYKKSANLEWWKIWDALYYNFINKHQKILKKNYATSRQVAHWTKKSKEEKQLLLNLAKKFKL